MRRAGPLFTLLAIAILTVSWNPGDALGCAVAPRLNQSVHIADESAIILWDKATNTEHFIRRATFQSASNDFGFLVPTPSKPELAEASDAAFDELARVTAPKIVRQPQPSAPSCGFGCSMAERASPNVGAPAPVRVLDQKRVAGYDAAVLEADDSNSLSVWLKDHDYEFSDVLHQWVEHYIEAKWKITAFKVAKQEKEAKTVSTSAVRLTFKTDQPFYPYREPTSTVKAGDNPPISRLLRVFFIGSERVDGMLETALWPGRAAWAGEMTAPNRDKIAEKLKMPATALPAKSWLTEFEDFSSPRPGKADVFFKRSDDQSKVERIHVEYYSSNLPGCLMCMAACAFVVGLRFTRRRSSAD